MVPTPLLLKVSWTCFHVFTRTQKDRLPHIYSAEHAEEIHTDAIFPESLLLVGTDGLSYIRAGLNGPPSHLLLLHLVPLQRSASYVTQ